MACTLLRIVQAAVSLRRRFECAIHSSFESVESGGEEQREQQQQEEPAPAQPRAEDLSTSEHLSRTFRLTFEEGDPDDQPDMTFLRASEGQEGAEGGAAYADAPASTSIDVLEDVSFPASPATAEDTSLALTLHSPEPFTPAASALPSPEAAPTVFPHVSQAPSPDSASAPPLPYHPDPSPAAVLPEAIPKVQVHEVSGSERSSSDSDSSSSSRCSVKSVRLRCADAVSPSSGCKPAKLIRSDAMVSSAEREASGSMRWMLMLQDSGTALLKEVEQGQSQEQEEQREAQDETQEEDERRGSDSDGSEVMAYSEWLMKGKQVLECESSSGEDNETRTGSEDKSEEDEDNEDDDEEEEDVQEDIDDYLDDSEEEYLDDEGEMMVEASFEDSFVDDGFVSLEMDDYDDDVIIEENEEDLERERMEEEMMLEIRRNLLQSSGRGVEAGEHRRVSRQYSPALYLPGIPESKVIQERKGAEVKEEAAAGGAVGGAAPGRLRHSSSRSSRSGKRSQRSPPVQRQRCIQLEGGQSEEDGAAAPQGRAASRPHPPPAPDSRPSHIEADVSRVPAASPPPEVPLVVVATAEGGTRTQALGRSRGRLQHPSAYSLTSGGGESRDVPPRTHAYHKYGSASFDLARPSRHEGARAAFHTTRSSFEGDRRLSMSLGGPRAAAEVFQPVVTLEKSPGAARRLASMEAGSRGERQLPEGPLRGGFRRSRSERVGGSSAGASPARSESLRVSRTRPHPQDVEMTELCGPRRLLALDEYSSSSRLSPRAGSSPSGAATEGAGEPLLSGSAMARYSWRTAGDVAALRQSSLENSELEDLMENRRHVEQRRLRLAADSTTPSDEDEEPRGKVRYNDTGSLEQVTRQVNEELADHLDEPDLTSRHSQEIKVQCRALWQLRTTLEEEDPDDQDSDSGRMEIHSSPDRHSPGRASDLDNVTSATSHTTSFESNTDAIVAGEGGGDGGTGGEPEVEVPREHGQSEAEVSQTPITLPSSEARRTSYRAILANRLKLDAANRPTLSSENSFDSVDTECSSTTDLSRPEVLTTSFDSTTDCPTDSTSDTHSHRLQQMKADSGYRSLEANNGRPPKLSKKQIHFVEDSLETPVDDPERDRSRERQRDPDSRTESREDLGDPQSKRERLRKGVAQLERRWSGKSHTKKRREALRERHASLDTALSGSVGGSLEGEGATTDELSGKRSVLARFLRTHRYPAAHYRLLQRDYSIDEKSDRLFKEFSRTEVPLEWEPPGRRGPRLYSGRRLHRHLDAEGSPRSHRRKLSPQDSIEEEDQVAAALWEGEASRPESFADSIGCDDLPVSFAVAEEVE
ncbi:uncharacterized protein LOC123510479 isoform X2 [Portunus trituberculatus]|uniref:uncharacterized protein LOC123510479 isoform X2 n=1 Tax=Portunus trituberculatus TaxID=210409 RepID=UPI001E1D0A48|nr:uncharacterized protein LOC123510479 isoform X2 [Portunus trituberculatus]